MTPSERWSQEELLSYLKTMLASLAKLAKEKRMPLVVYLIEMARSEVASELRKLRIADRDSNVA